MPNTADNQAPRDHRAAADSRDLLAAIEQLLAVNGNDVHLMRIANWLDLHALRTNYAEAVLKAHRLLHLARAEIQALRQDRERLDWMTGKSLEIGYVDGSDGDSTIGVWVIHGSVNDRQWTLTGEGADVRAALSAALAAPTAGRTEQEGNG